MAKVKRNDSCPCGSGKKYKKCCLRRVEIQRDAKIDAIRAAQRQNPKVASVKDESGNEKEFEHDQETGSMIVTPDKANKIVTLDELDPEETEVMMQQAANMLKKREKGITIVKK